MSAYGNLVCFQPCTVQQAKSTEDYHTNPPLDQQQPDELATPTAMRLYTQYCMPPNKMSRLQRHQTEGRQGCKVISFSLTGVHVAHILLVLFAEDHAIASEMNHHYTTHDYGDTDNAHIAPGDEGFEFSHARGEYADFNGIHKGFSELAWYVYGIDHHRIALTPLQSSS